MKNDMKCNASGLGKKTATAFRLERATAGTVLSVLAAVMVLFPWRAQAADECGPGPVVECGATSYANGITYSSAVDLSVTKTNTGTTSITNNGVNLTVSGAADVSWDSSIGSITGAAGTAGPVLDIRAVDGDIDVLTSGVTGNAASVTHGIRAEATGSGGIGIVTNGNVSATNATSGQAGIAAISAGGDISITSNAVVSGRQYGIQARAAGGGNIVVTAFSEPRATGPDGFSIQAVAEAGTITLNLHASSLNPALTAAPGIISASGGGLKTINVLGAVGAWRDGRGGFYGGNETTSSELMGSGAAEVRLAGPSAHLLGGINAAGNSGDVAIINEAGSGGWSFAGNVVELGSGNDVINNGGFIMAGVYGQGNLSLREFREAGIAFGAGEDAFINSGILMIGGASFTFTRADTGIEGDSILGRYRIQDTATIAAEAVFQDLERFDNSGLIVLGGDYYNGGTSGHQTDPLFPSVIGPRFYPTDATGDAYCRAVLGIGVANRPLDGFPCTASRGIRDTDQMAISTLSMPGTLFTGSGNSTIKLDAMFGKGVPQINCQDRTGGVEQYFRLPGADCVDLRGGETAGSTQVIVRDALPNDQGAGNVDGIVIVDVSGGTSAAEHFTLSPESDHYRETAGGRGVIDKGLFVFPLVYDETTQQHKLVGIPGASALQLPLLTHAAQSLARQVTASGLDERAQNVRAGLRSGSAVNGGFWGEFGQSTIERDLIQPMAAAGETFAFNNDYEQDSSTMILGGDFLIPGGDKTAWLLGGSIGYARAELGFTQSGNRADLEGVVLGVHGGYQTGNWFLNAGYSQSFLQVDDYVPTFNLSTDGSGADTKAQTQSLRIDGGRRFSLTDALHVEPLASIAWIKADFDDLVVASPDNPLATSNTAKFGNAVSLRGALGARIGFDQAISALRLHYALTGRYWNEFDGQTDVRISSTGPDASLSNTFDGSFLDLVGRISVSDANGLVSGYLDATSVSGDDYSSLGFSAGFRYQW